MELRGFKSSDIGLIPETWDCSPLRTYLDLLTDFDANGSFADMAENVNTTWGSGFAWYVRATDLEQNLPLSEVRYADKDSYDFLKKSALFGGEILLAKRGEIGKVYLFKMRTHYATLAPNLYLLKLNKNIDGNYLYWYLLSERGQESLKGINASTSLGAIYKEDVKNLLIPVPPISEQRNISTTIGEIDELILNLEKLIHKKTAIKQGVIQQLVTGKMRLAGYEGNWQTINMSMQSKLKARIGWQGLTTAEYLDVGYSYLVTGTDFDKGRINWSRCHFVSKDRYEQDPNIQIENGDVLLTKDGTIGKVALVDGLKRPATLNSGVFVIRPLNNAYSARFLYYVLSSSVFEDFLDKLAAGSTISHLYQKDLVEFEFNAPPTIEEQEDIASLIYDMESEIKELQYQREKYVNLKVGMMNELLTGRTRLI